MRYRTNASRTNSGRSVRRCTTHAPHTNGPMKPDHEINRMIRRKNAQVAHARPERIPRRQRPALLEIVLVGKDAAFGTPTGSRGVDDAGDVILLAHHEVGRAFALEILPAKRTRQIRAQRSFRHQNDFGRDLLKVWRLQ